MIIRKSKDQDIHSLCSLHVDSIKHFCSDHYPESSILDWVASKKADTYKNFPEGVTLLVAEENNQIIGFGIINLLSQSIDSVYLRPGCSGKGYGKAILKALEDIALQESVKELSLCSTLNAVEFYNHMGYRGKTHTIFTLRSGAELKCVEMSKQL